MRLQGVAHWADQEKSLSHTLFICLIPAYAIVAIP